jgi:hypothetical protein
VALDASNGQALWDNVPLTNSDSGAIGVPDVTNDGSEDVLSISNGMLKLYDGVTGIEETWFAAIAAESVVHWNAPTPNNDTDGDGITDDEDNCPESDLKETVVINCCDSGVENQLFDDGCTMSDLIAVCARGVKNHGQFVSCVSHLTNDWKKQDLITGKEKGAIQSCAAQSDTCEGLMIEITDPTTDDYYDPPGTPSAISLAGTASGDDEIVEVSWTNNRGGSGTATGTTNWSISDITLYCGDHNIITVTAEDSEGNTATDTLTVDVAPCPPGGLNIIQLFLYFMKQIGNG